MQTAAALGRKKLWFPCMFVALLFTAAPTVILGQSGQSGQDSKFASEAASGGMTEVKLGQLAQENGSSNAVKEFGRRMETDHTKAGERIEASGFSIGHLAPIGHVHRGPSDVQPAVETARRRF